MSLLHFSGVNEDEMLSWGLRSLFVVENRVKEHYFSFWVASICAARHAQITTT